MNLLEKTISAIRPIAAEAEAGARARPARLTKPAGSLGALEDLSVRIAGITGEPRPRLGEGTGAVLAMMICDSACRILDEMATFGEAGVTGA